MSTSNELQQLIIDGFSDKGSLINQNDMQALEKGLRELDVSDETKGYTLPLLDTIGMNLSGKFSCQIKDT